MILASLTGIVRVNLSLHPILLIFKVRYAFPHIIENGLWANYCIEALFTPEFVSKHIVRQFEFTAKTISYMSELQITRCPRTRLYT